jgi:putative ABC transport system substrate-binding protein
MPVVGYLSADSAPSSPDAPFFAAFRRGLSDTGYVEGQNLAIEYRLAEGHYDRLPALAADLVGRKVDLIVSIGAASSLAAKNATSSIPIVFKGVSDPVGSGLVASLARPGGNLTGFSNLAIELGPKRFELCPSGFPKPRIALLVNPNSPNIELAIRDMEEAARLKRVQLAILKAGTESEINAAFATLVEQHAGAIVENKRLGAALAFARELQASYPPNRRRGDPRRQRPPNNLEAPGRPTKGRPSRKVLAAAAAE